MTPLPKRRHSSRRGGKRIASIHQDLLGLVQCSNCSKWKKPHQVCASCGFYDGKQIVAQKEKKKKT